MSTQNLNDKLLKLICVEAFRRGLAGWRIGAASAALWCWHWNVEECWL
jgi:hypothetical protein